MTEKKYEHIVSTKKTYDAIIVPGIPYTGQSWGALMKSRVIWSWVLYKNGIAKNVIFSGGAVHTPYKEAIVMGIYAQKLGIPKENIFYDTCAFHSTENVFYASLIAEEQGFETLAVASDFYQCYFLKQFIRKKFNNNIDQIPLVRDSINCYNDLDVCIDPSPAKISNASSFIPLTEKKSYFTRMKGTLGWNINWQKTAQKNSLTMQLP